MDILNIYLIWFYIHLTYIPSDVVVVIHFRLAFWIWKNKWRTNRPVAILNDWIWEILRRKLMLNKMLGFTWPLVSWRTENNILQWKRNLYETQQWISVPSKTRASTSSLHTVSVCACMHVCARVHCAWQEMWLNALNKRGQFVFAGERNKTWSRTRLKRLTSLRSPAVF